MNTAEYKRLAFSTLDVKLTKIGLRTLARKTPISNTVNAIIGLNTSVGDLIQVMTPFLLGAQLKKLPEFQHQVKQNLGDILYCLVILSRYTKAKVPSNSKKVRLKSSTISASLMKVDNIANIMLQSVQDTFQGEELDPEKLKMPVEDALEVVYSLCLEILDMPPQPVMEEHAEMLKCMIPVGNAELVDSEAEKEKEEA